MSVAGKVQPMKVYSNQLVLALNLVPGLYPQFYLDTLNGAEYEVEILCEVFAHRAELEFTYQVDHCSFLFLPLSCFEK